jgi:hypothetical protein
MSDNSNLMVPRFLVHTVLNEGKSKEAGRPIYDEMEICEIRFAANKQTVAVFPAHEVWKVVETPDGMREPQTYAMRFPELYRKFKAGEAQAMSGTPLEELPFLTAGKRLELKALSIFTAETLAALDGGPLKQLGMQGRELKNQAQAYLDNAAGSADVTKLAAANESLKDQVRVLQEQFRAIQAGAQAKTVPATESAFDTWDDADIKAYIESETGSKPRGNPSHATLVGMADEIEQAKVAA